MPPGMADGTILVHSLEALRDARAATGSGGAPSIYPFELFEQCWSLYFLMRGGTPSRVLRPEVISLARHTIGGRLGMSQHGVPVDGDDTSVLLTLLRYCGLPADVGVLSPFERDRGYATYQFERTVSVSTNVHVLPLVEPNRAKNIVEALRDSRIANAYWLDKWHVSPYYPTAEAVTVLRDIAPDLHRDAVRWLLSTQHEDGSWGCAGGSCEETAYVVLALMDSDVADGVDAGMRYLLTRRGTEEFPAMWIGKTLFTPFRVVQAAVTAAHLCYEKRTDAAS